MNKSQPPAKLFKAKYNYSYWTRHKVYRMIRSGFLEDETGNNIQVSESLLREYFTETTYVK